MKIFSNTGAAIRYNSKELALAGKPETRLLMSDSIRFDENSSEATRISRGAAEGGGTSSTKSELKLPNRIGRYEVLSSLGRGGFGMVYLATDPQLGRKVAIKVPRWDRSLGEGEVEKFLREGRLLAKADHPGIVRVHDVGITDEGIPFVVMQYIEGISMSQALKVRPFSIAEAVELLLKVGDSLLHAHKCGLVHRDLKPGNIILGTDGRVHLVDFGLALHDQLTPNELGEENVAGTPSFMAPEQIRGENHLVDGQTDIWAFGVIMYLILVGRLPFRGTTVKELTRAICYKNPRPPRQLDDKIPRELERICLKCLAKLIEDRFPSMIDVMDDLQTWLASISKNNADQLIEAQRNREIHERLLALEQATPHLDPLNRPAPSPHTPNSTENHASDRNSNKHDSLVTASDKASLQIIPKGLRAFDQNDHEFFLKLLPGPVDRHGIPESIRFWISRLDVDKQVAQIPIGILYGPSGCGKSSFVRAGLIPQLSKHVVSIYIDSTNPELERRTVEAINREIHEVSPQSTLHEAIRKIRHGHHLRHGDKLLLIFDQFEQWLNRCDDINHHPFTLAIRQCNAERVQALFLIRDDFWLSTSQFFRALDQRITESLNALSLPLMDREHAIHVLAAIGRAYNRLPSDNTFSPGERKFLKEAVGAIAQRNKVVCVHLTVLAETFRDRPWTHAEFVAAGGWRGIASEFVAGKFIDPTVPQFVRRNTDLACKILSQLLPSSAVDLKGHARSIAQIAEGCGLSSDHPALLEMMAYLERDGALISPTEIADGDDQAKIRYALSHDFLVDPVRGWTEAKQNATLRGRAESEFTQLADYWRINPQTKFLPSFFQCCRYAFLVSNNIKTAHKAYWTKAKRTTLVRSSFWTAAVLLIAAGIILLNNAKRSAELAHRVESFLNTPPASFVASAKEFDPWVRPAKRILEQTAANSNELGKKMRAQAILVAKGHLPVSESGLLESLENAAAEDFVLFQFALRDQGPEFAALLETKQPLLSRKQSIRAAALLASLGIFQNLTELLAEQEDPTLRYQTIAELRNWNGGWCWIGALESQWRQSKAEPLFYGVGVSIGLTPPQGLSSQQRLEIAEFLRQIYESHPRAGVHFAARYALERHGFEIPKVTTLLNPQCNWKHLYVVIDGDEIEIPFVRIQPGEYQPGAGYPDFDIYNHPDKPLQSGKIEATYWMSAIEVPPTLIAKYADVSTIRNPTKHVLEWISWTDCAGMCDWLNAKLDQAAYYQTTENDSGAQPEENSSGKSTSFRLPTADEFEYAGRAGANTQFHFGQDVELLPIFCLTIAPTVQTSSFNAPPNAWGLFHLADGTQEYTNSKYRELIVLKGGFTAGGPDVFSCSYTFVNMKNAALKNTGFRLCMSE